MHDTLSSSPGPASDLLCDWGQSQDQIGRPSEAPGAEQNADAHPRVIKIKATQLQRSMRKVINRSSEFSHGDDPEALGRNKKLNYP